MRCFRPSYFQARNEEVLEEPDRTNKQENMQRYISRVREGLPIFDEEQFSIPGMIQIPPL